MPERLLVITNAKPFPYMQSDSGQGGWDVTTYQPSAKAKGIKDNNNGQISKTTSAHLKWPKSKRKLPRVLYLHCTSNLGSPF